MAFRTRGLSWLSSKAARLVREYRISAERLAWRGAVNPEEWPEIERQHIDASAALCHYIADLEEYRRVNKPKKRGKQHG